MIQVIAGHLGCGSWRFKNVNGVTLLAHVQAFSRNTEYRIGPDQVLGYEIEKTDNKVHTVKINFSQEQYCRALMDASDLAQLDIMVESQQSVPVIEHNHQKWLNGLIIFSIICIIFEMVK